ncbi:MAG: DUF6282 family protein [Gaiellaceae bacterium]
MFDLHVHSAPCVLPRLGDDVETVGWYEAAGFTGCVLKGHAEPTAGRARAAAAGRRVAVHGAVVLNGAVGGLNPGAVEAALGLGARVVWMPTLDARAHLDAGLPRPRLGAAVFAIPPVDPTNESAVLEICTLVAEADAVLATGHLSGPEIAWLLPRARAAGIRRVLLTHPSFMVPSLDASTTRALAEQGAYVEVTAYQLLHQPELTAARLAAFVRDVGPERCLLSSDAGQPDSPRPAEALGRLVEALAAEGLDRGRLDAMAAEVPERLVTL